MGDSYRIECAGKDAEMGRMTGGAAEELHGMKSLLDSAGR
jgi:hypothetical protein